MVQIERLDVIGLENIRERLKVLICKVRDLRLDQNEYICLKFLILLNPGLRSTLLPVFFKFITSHYMKRLFDDSSDIFTPL